MASKKKNTSIQKPIVDRNIPDINTLVTKRFNSILNEEFSNSLTRLKGEIVGCKVFKNNCGIGFTLRENESMIKCIAWASHIDIDKIQSNENKNCTVIGSILQKRYFGGFDIELVLSNDVLYDNDESKMNSLKEECEQKKLFEKKKEIIWENVNKIGIISKTGTQGYNDFMTQFKIPKFISLIQIALEGDKTEKELIKAIKELQETDVDVIIIIRGGGSTIDISDSFDIISIFESIKNSSIPVITAIGHEADKDDKLLITCISDYDYPTPTRAALDLNQIFIKPQLYKLQEYLYNLNDIFYNSSETELENECIILRCLVDKVFKDKFGGIVLQMDEGDNCVIIQIGDMFYKNLIDYTNPIDITKEDIELKKQLEYGLSKNDIDIIKMNVRLLNKDKKLNILLEKSIKKIEIIEKENKIFTDIKPKKLKSLYYKKSKLNDLKNIDNKKMTQLKAGYLWNIDFFENLINQDDQSEIKEIFDFCESL